MIRNAMIVLALAGSAALLGSTWREPAGATSQMAPPAGYDLAASFTEEFDGKALDRKKWGRIFAPPNGRDRSVLKRNLWNNGEREVYFDPEFLSLGIEPLKVAGGSLKITAEPMAPATLAAVQRHVSTMPAGFASNATLKAVKYQSGLISGRDHFTQQYGYFEVRARWTKGRGLWPAIWLLPDDGSWPPEIDIMESLGHDDRTVYHSTHSKFTPRSSSIKVGISGSTSDYHRYGLLWLPWSTEYYIDGKKVATIPTSPDMTKPMYLVINLAVGGHWPGDPDSSTVFPATMEVDSVRIWKFRSLPVAPAAGPAK